ncbi:MAG TPA: hypothetical protein VKX46_06390 [Ktedonobacteraceae bacterium]|nr:hypothetical protein [Ktedonobacteraceae bacterium]
MVIKRIGHPCNKVLCCPMEQNETELAVHTYEIVTLRLIPA